MTPTQPSQAVEAAIACFEEIIAHDDQHAFTARVGLAALRAELPRPEVAAVGDARFDSVAMILRDVCECERPNKWDIGAIEITVTDLAEILNRHLGVCPECKGSGIRDSGGVQPWGEAIEVPCGCAASRVPVALPAEPEWANFMVLNDGVWLCFEREPKMVDGYPLTQGGRWGPRPTTPAPKQGDAKDARPDSSKVICPQCTYQFRATPEDAQIFKHRLHDVLEVVRRYLPPGGPSANDAMGEITALVDPWPSDSFHSAGGECGGVQAHPMNYKGMWLASVSTLDKIDALLGLPEDGCNDPDVTLGALEDYMSGVKDIVGSSTFTIKDVRAWIAQGQARALAIDPDAAILASKATAAGEVNHGQ